MSWSTEMPRRRWVFSTFIAGECRDVLTTYSKYHSIKPHLRSKVIPLEWLRGLFASTTHSVTRNHNLIRGFTHTVTLSRFSAALELNVAGCCFWTRMTLNLGNVQTFSRLKGLFHTVFSYSCFLFIVSLAPLFICTEFSADSAWIWQSSLT